MKKINLAITGCMGRMGQQIIKSARSDKNFKIRYKTIITTKTIIAQIDRFVKNCFNFELDLRNAGRTNINTAIKDIVGIASSNPIF